MAIEQDTALTRRRARWRARLAAGGALALMATSAAWADETGHHHDAGQAADAATAVDEAVVFARGERKIGHALAASEGSIGGADLLVRPLLRVGELLEAVPGMVAAQHSGSGKANQYFLRGFNLDHGSDYTTYIDGVQMNLRSHGHGQGYLDLNGLIPEIIEREDFRKGPYRADGGDFAMAGAAYMTTLDHIARPFVSLETGSYGYGRLAAGGTQAVGGGDLTLVAQAKVYDGPWQAAERLRHYAVFAEYARDTDLGRLALSLHGYHGRWRPTEQIPERIIGTSICADAYCSPDPSARGVTSRVIANARLEGQAWSGNLYVQAYDWTMYSNPTYANADGSSAQIKQFDRRWIVGGQARRDWTLSPSLSLSTGTEARLDLIDRVGVHNTDKRAFVASLGAFGVDELSSAAYAEAVWTPIQGLRLTAGLRGDYYGFDVEALDAAAAALGQGRGHDTLLSPKFGAAARISPNVELYANWGRGFHSNDVRGVVNVATPVEVLVPGEGGEVGARLEAGPWSLTATYWTLDLDSELKFVGDSNAVEPSEASRRRGYELVAFWRPKPWLAIDANWTASHARYRNGDYIPNAFENAGQIGVAIVKDAWELSLRLRHLGPYPLIEDNSVRDGGSDVVNVRAARKWGHVDLYAEALNLLGSRDKDIAYFYESYIPAVDAGGPVEDRLSRVVEPRTVRVGARFNF